MHFKQNNKESKTYVQGLRPFGTTLPRGLKGILKKNGYNYSEIISKWKILVGKEISTLALPESIKIRKGQESGTLVVIVNRGNEIDIEYSKREIIEKINSFFGYKLINEIKLKTANFKNIINKNKQTDSKINENFKKKISKIKSKEIQESLYNLIKSINK